MTRRIVGGGPGGASDAAPIRPTARPAHRPVAIDRVAESTAGMEMTVAERMDLLRFVCSFVWTDLKVTQAERDLVMRICGRLALHDREVAQVKQWLAVPPPPESVDPTQVPKAHRQMFLRAAELAAQADGHVAPAESEALATFRELIEG